MDNVMERIADRPRRLYQRAVLAVALVLVSYCLTFAISGSVAGLVSRSIKGGGVFVNLGFFSALVFLVIPRLLKLPRGKLPFREYLQAVGLRTGGSLGRIVILALSCSVIFAVSQLCGSLIYYAVHPGRYTLDISRHGLLDPGCITAGVFEEIVMRGVIVTLLLGVFSRRKAVVVSAGIFGGFHLLNLLNPGANTVWVLAQVVWAFGLGIMYAYLFITTRSILPGILIHYLVNATVNVWFKGPVAGGEIASALYGIPFFGLLPAGIAVLWGRYLWNVARPKPGIVTATAPNGART